MRLFNFRFLALALLAFCLMACLGNSSFAGQGKDRRQARRDARHGNTSQTTVTTTSSYRGVSRGCQDCQGGCQTQQSGKAGGPKVIVVPFTGGTLACPDSKCPKK